MADPRYDPDDSTVVYTVKELLKDIKTEQTTGFARVELAMEAKADKADIERLDLRVDRHQHEIEALKSDKHDEDIETRTVTTVENKRKARHWTFVEKAFAAVTTVLLTVGTTLGGLAVFGVHI